MSEPIVGWTPPEAWLMAELAARGLVATRDGGAPERATREGGFRVEVVPVGEFLALTITLDASRATLALDPAGDEANPWREGWSLSLARGDARWELSAGAPAVTLDGARDGAYRASLRVRAQAVCAELDGVPERVPLQDVAFQRYTRQSSAAPRDGATPPPWMTPTAPEPSPWWEIDLGATRCVVVLGLDLAPLPPGTRVTLYAYGAPRPSGAMWPGSILREEVIGAPGRERFVDDASVCRFVRVALTAPAGAAVSLAVRSLELHAAPLYADTLAATMRRAFALFARRPLTLARNGERGPYRTERTYAEVWRRASALARALAARLERPGGARVVLATMTRNREAWIVAELAALMRGYLVVALSPEDPDARLAAELRLAEPACVVCEGPDVDRLTALGGDALRLLVVCDGRAAAPRRAGFEALLREGRGATAPTPKPRADDDPYAVLFTSGSTGAPKGAVRTYRGFLQVIASYALGHSPRHLSFQTVAHLSERMYLPALLAHGGCVAFSAGAAHLFEELRALQPTSVGAVPRLYEALRADHQRRLRDARERTPDDPEAEAAVWRETGSAFGPRIMALSAGSAPVGDELLAFLRRAFPDVWVSDGYGSTEVGSIAYDGRILPHVEVKLRPRPELATPGGSERGEILVRSPHQIAGYLGDPAATAAAIDADGFFATGDLGEREPDGRVRVVGRVRNTVKLAHGEFVSAERVEVALAGHPVVDRVFVRPRHGATGFAALVFPKAEALARLLGGDGGRRSEAASVVLAALRAHGLGAGLQRHELPCAALLVDEAPTVDNGLLTASGKLARAALAERHGAALDALVSGEGAGATSASRVAAVLAAALGRSVGDDDALATLAGDSLAVASALAALSDAFGREVPVAWWFEVATVASLAARLGDAHAGAGAHAATAQATVDRAWEAPTPAALSGGPLAAVLLTGATGLLGAHLAACLRARGVEVLCLVRAADDDAARRRVAAALQARRLDEALDDGLRAVAGDLAAPGAGLGRALGRFDAIVHAGAAVSWLAPYATLRGPNVLGTRALLTLAAERGVPMHHVSTISAAPADGDEASTLPFEAALASTPYVLTKWIAEELVRRAAVRGLPTAIYRPAMIAPDTRTGLGNPEDFPSRYLRGCVELGRYVDRDDAVFDMTPVDFVAEAIVALLLAHPRGGGTWHLANVEGSWSFAALGRAMAAAGCPVAPAAYADFRAALLRAKGSRLHALAGFFPERFSLGMGPWPCARTLAALEALGVRRPRVDAALVARYVAALEADGARRRRG